MPRRYKKPKKRTKKKTLRRQRHRRRRRTKKRGGDYSIMAKDLMKSNVEKKMMEDEKRREQEFRNKMKAKIAAREKMTPNQLLMQRRIRVSPSQVRTMKNIPHPLRGGKRKTRRKRRSRKR